jgi:hypothetical protein
MARPRKVTAIVAQLTDNERRVVLLLNEYEEWATALDLHANHTTLHPLNKKGVIEGIKTPGLPWRWRFTSFGHEVVADILSQGKAP